MPKKYCVYARKSIIPSKTLLLTPADPLHCVHMKKLLVAIVEDDTAIAAMYKMRLELAGYRVVTATNGEQGLSLCKKERPDLILLDLRMPKMSGDEMLARLRGTDWGNEMRVIILTNISKNEAPMGLRFLHVDRYVVKVHSTPKQVVDIVDEILNVKTYRKEQSVPSLS